MRIKTAEHHVPGTVQGRESGEVDETQPYWLDRDEGDAIWMFDSMDTIKADAAATGGSFSLFEFLDSTGSTVPLHVNREWDRGFYVLSGEYTFVLGGDTVSASAGAWVFCPRGTPSLGDAIRRKAGCSM